MDWKQHQAPSHKENKPPTHPPTHPTQIEHVPRLFGGRTRVLGRGRGPDRLLRRAHGRAAPRHPAAHFGHGFVCPAAGHPGLPRGRGGQGVRERDKWAGHAHHSGVWRGRLGQRRTYVFCLGEGGGGSVSVCVVSEEASPLPLHSFFFYSPPSFLSYAQTQHIRWSRNRSRTRKRPCSCTWTNHPCTNR